MLPSPRFDLSELKYIISNLDISFCMQTGKRGRSGMHASRLRRQDKTQHLHGALSAPSPADQHYRINNVQYHVTEKRPIKSGGNSMSCNIQGPSNLPLLSPSTGLLRESTRSNQASARKSQMRCQVKPTMVSAARTELLPLIRENIEESLSIK